MIKRDIIFLGCTRFSESILESLIENNFNIKAIFSIPKKFNISYNSKKVFNTNYCDLEPYSQKLNIPFFLIDSKQSKKLDDFYDLIFSYKPDVIIAAGWYYMIPKRVREIPKHGVWGLHSSLLPDYAGGAPLVWAIINGEKKTGVTLFKIDKGVDDGDIIFQSEIEIKNEDHIRHVLKKVTIESKKILIKALKSKHLTYKPQDKSKIKIYPQRKPEDGEINWEWPPTRIKNFIRAQSRPYPGAWSIINNRKVFFWETNYEKKLKKYENL